MKKLCTVSVLAFGLFSNFFNMQANAEEYASSYSQKHDNVYSKLSNTSQNDPYDTKLRNDLKNIKLAFDFKIPEALRKKSIIGYAPVGAYIKSSSGKEGWYGIAIIFHDNRLGKCTYNFHADHFIKQGDYYKYNDNSFLSESSGGSYKDSVQNLSWYSKTVSHHISCHRNSSTDSSRDLRKLAKEIDKAFFVPFDKE